MGKKQIPSNHWFLRLVVIVVMGNEARTSHQEQMKSDILPFDVSRRLSGMQYILILKYSLIPPNSQDPINLS